MGNFDDFSNAVVSGTKGLAQKTLKDFLKAAEDDTKAFLASAENDLKLWTKQLADGDIDKEQFKFLVRAQAGLAQMHALTQAGIAAAQIQKFRDALIDLVIEAAFKTFLP